MSSPSPATDSAVSSSSSSSTLSAALARLPSKWHPDTKVPTLYWFPFSQPSRAVAQLLSEGSITHKKISIDIGSKKEQKDPLYLEFINPAGLVPALFKPAEGAWMAESNDIMKYLISSYPDSLSSFYPAASDSTAVSFIESQLAFISSTVRPIATGLIRAVASAKDKVEVRRLMKETPTLVENIERHFEESEKLYPASEGKESVVYFAGRTATIADLQLYHEIVATKDIGFFPWDEKTAPKLTRWYDAMAQRPATKKTYSSIKTAVSAVSLILKLKRCFGGVTL